MSASRHARLSNKSSQPFHDVRRNWSDLMEEVMEVEVMSVDLACSSSSSTPLTAAERSSQNTSATRHPGGRSFQRS